jgi:hypothetical protein
MHPGFDLILVDMPEGLPVPGVSNPESSIPSWNALPDSWLQPIFEYADYHLHDDGAFIVIHPQSSAAKTSIHQHCKAYSFKKKKDWWGMNRLHLTHPSDVGNEVRFLIFKLRYIFYNLIFFNLKF